MRNNTYIGIAFIVLIFGIIFIPKIFRRLSNGDVTRGGRMHAVGGIDSEIEDHGLVYISQNGKDRKVPAFSFLNQDNDTITNVDYRGKVYLVDFIFTRCPNICIPMSHNMQLIAEEFKDRTDFGIASFSLDPEYDQPEILKQYAADYGVTHPHWNFMTGDRKEIRDLSNTGFYLPAAEGNLEPKDLYHSGLFALVDKNGFIRSRKDKFGNPIIYYRGFIPAGGEETADGETPQIDILIEDIKKLLD